MAAPSIAIRRQGAKFLHEILSAQRAVAFSSASRHYMVKTSSIFQKSTGNDERVKQLMGRGLPKARAIPGVKNIIVIASGKGGVGKSTVAVNLALSVSHLQKCSVGLLDADVFGPSIPRMLNLSGHQPEANKDGKILPLQNYGLSCMSMGFLVDEKSPIVWRGLMVMQAIQRLLFEVAWGNIEYLFIDMPPGTGDTQLSISQLVPVSGAVIVSTPQDIALLDARKGAEMFKKVNIPVLGLIQNMSIYHCPNCGHQSHIFGQDGVRHMAQEINVDLLGEIPLHMDICQTCDQGKPISISAPSGQHATIFNDIAKHLMTSLRKQEKG
ncbi:iron-sulfur cluster transfer protein NUBPL-like isoform X2 [Apostichopus japonicus]|uniref:iron-sulfur cluster transfer protein NUBPL-like isoform X2 n=1 Tax=Stichopus japonicus TaxID=307972 RepID=UPI003AB18E5F